MFRVTGFICFLVILFFAKLFLLEDLRATEKDPAFCTLILAVVEDSKTHEPTLKAIIRKKWNSVAGLEYLITHMNEFRVAELVPAPTSGTSELLLDIQLQQPTTNENVEVPWLIRILYEIHLQRIPGQASSEARQARARLAHKADFIGGSIDHLPEGEKRSRFENILKIVKQELQNTHSTSSIPPPMTTDRREQIDLVIQEILLKEEDISMLYGALEAWIAMGYLIGPSSDFYGRTSDAVAFSLTTEPIRRDLYWHNVLYVLEKIKVAQESEPSDPRRDYATQWVERFFKIDAPLATRRAVNPPKTYAGNRVIDLLQEFYFKKFAERSSGSNKP